VKIMFSSWACPTCGKEIKNGALAERSHIVSHVRRGDFVIKTEYWNYGTEPHEIIVSVEG
jgi:hypothetical protein